MFEPQFDYLHLDKSKFNSVVKPNLFKSYKQELRCSEYECHFNKQCSQVSKSYNYDNKVATLGRGSKYNSSGYNIYLNFEKYLIPGPILGESIDRCYFPIFGMESITDQENSKNGMFLGNIFMDKYFVVHERDD